MRIYKRSIMTDGFNSLEVVLDKNDLIGLVKTTSPYYTEFENEDIKPHGNYIGGFHDKWIWDSASLAELPANKLWDIYQTCRKSWK